jgi:hypothetical protein
LSSQNRAPSAGPARPGGPAPPTPPATCSNSVPRRVREACRGARHLRSVCAHGSPICSPGLSVRVRCVTTLTAQNLSRCCPASFSPCVPGPAPIRRSCYRCSKMACGLGNNTQFTQRSRGFRRTSQEGKSWTDSGAAAGTADALPVHGAHQGNCCSTPNSRTGSAVTAPTACPGTRRASRHRASQLHRLLNSS